MGDSETRLESFSAAIKSGIKMVEFDLRMTEDGELVVYHGPPGMEGVNILRDKTLAQAEKEMGRSLPRFSQVLEVTNGQIALAIEVKESDIIEKILDETRGLDPGSFAIISFLDQVVKKTKEVNPDIRSGLILGMYGIGIKKRLSEIFPQSRKQKSGADFIAAERRIYNASPAKESFKDSFLWGVNEEQDLEKALRDPRIAGVITDYPKRALEVQKKIFVT